MARSESLRFTMPDGTVKTSLCSASTPARDVAKVLSPSSPIYVYFRRSDKSEHFIPESDSVLKVFNDERRNVTLVCKTTAPSGVTTDADLVAQFDSLGIEEDGAKKGPNVTGDDFDALLDSLAFDVDGGGGDETGGIDFGAFDAAAAKDYCGACNELIDLDPLSAFGQTFHKGCIGCAICFKTFDQITSPLVEGSDGQAYCEDDYNEAFAPKCAKCEKPIIGACTNALGKSWHPDCFVCTKCEKPFVGTFFESGGMPFCEQDYYTELGLMCPECDRPILGKALNARGVRYHPQHFVCTYCKAKLKGQQFWVHDSRLYCKEHHLAFYG